LKRPYLTYLLAVVLPSVLAVGAILAAALSEWSQVRRASDARLAHILLTAFEQDLGRATDSLVAAAEATTALDGAQAAVRRALAGDTVTGIRPAGPTAEVFALAPPGDRDPPGSVRFASTPLDGTMPRRIGRATGYALSLYLNGRRWASTDDPAGPEELPEEGAEASYGALAALGGVPAARAAVVAVTRRLDRVRGPVPVPLVLTIGLLFVFAALSGWIQIAGGPPGTPPGRSRSMVLLALVPALTAGAFAIQLERAFEARLHDSDTGDLVRALAAAGVRGVTASPDAVFRLTGYDATMLHRGKVVASAPAGPAPALASLPLPPAALTTSGRVVTRDGPASYAAMRTDGDTVLVVTRPESGAARARLRGRARTLAGLLGAWILGVGAVWAVRRRGSTPRLSG
jgi:hypothetical protein